jgi:hypothetical protein
MALAANASYTIRDNKRAAVEAFNAAEIYNGAYLMGGSRDHATANLPGRVRAWNDEAGAIPLGFATQRKTGDTAAAPPVEGEIDLAGRVMKNIAVTGLAGTVADNFRVVYMTDDATFTLTRPTLGHPIGLVMKWISATNADVYFFGFGELCAIGMGGAAKRRELLGLVTAGAATGNVATGILAPSHGRILSVYGIVVIEPTDADVVQTINLEIDGTNVTGGVVTFQHDSAVAAKLAGTAVTAANVFNEGSLIDIETVATVAGTTADPGLLAVYADVLIEPGL